MSVVAIVGGATGVVLAALAIRYQVRLTRPKLRLSWGTRALDTTGAKVFGVSNIGMRAATIQGPIWKIEADSYEPGNGPHIWRVNGADDWSSATHSVRLDQGAAVELLITYEDLEEFLANDASEQPTEFRVGVRIDGKRIQTTAVTLVL